MSRTIREDCYEYSFYSFGLLAIIVSLLPSVLCLVFIRVASNNNRSDKPFSASERKQTFFEIFGIAIVGPVLLFCLMFAMAAVPYLAIIGVLLMILAYAYPMMLFWDMDLGAAVFWSVLLLGMQLTIGYYV